MLWSVLQIDAFYKREEKGWANMIELGIIPIGVCQAYYLGLQDKKIKVATFRRWASVKGSAPLRPSLCIFCSSLTPCLFGCCAPDITLLCVQNLPAFQNFARVPPPSWTQILRCVVFEVFNSQILGRV